MTNLIECLRCHGKFTRAEIHTVCIGKQVACKACHSEQTGERLAKKAAHKKAIFADQQRSLAAERKAKIKKETDDLMVQALPQVKPGKPSQAKTSTRRNIEDILEDRALKIEIEL